MSYGRCFLKITQDSKEQLPLKFGRYKCVLDQVVHNLNVGDYSCELQFEFKKDLVKIESKTVYERKSKGDLWSTMTSGYERFKREFNRGVEQGLRLILIIECNIDQIAKGHHFYKKGGGLTQSEFPGTAMCKKLETMRKRYGLEVVYCKGRLDMQRYMVERWMAECRQRLDEFKEKGVIEKDK